MTTQSTTIDVGQEPADGPTPADPATIPPVDDLENEEPIQKQRPEKDRPPALKDRMRLGEALRPGSSLTSPNGIFSLILQDDGNLVLYKTMEGKATSLWDTGTAGKKSVVMAKLGRDGRLFLLDKFARDVANYSKANNTNDGRSGYGNVVENPIRLWLRVNDNGNMAIYSNSLKVWETGTEQRFPPTGHQMRCKKYIGVGEELKSQNGKYNLTLQKDGNLVLHKVDEDMKKTTPWSTLTYADGGSSQDVSVKALLQEDGNFCLLSSRDKPNWQSGSAGKDTTLTLRDDGSIVITSADNEIWSTGSPERRNVNALKFGERCAPGDEIVSSNKKYRLVYQWDEDLVLFGENNEVLWNAERKASPARPGCMKIDEDGRLTLYDRDNNVKWQSVNDSTTRKQTAALILREDGQLVILDASGAILWAPRAEKNAPQPCIRLNYLQYITLGQKLTSANGNYAMKITDQGSLVIQHISGLNVWEFVPKINPGRRLLMQEDGNLVLEDEKRSILWSTGTSQRKESLYIENDGTAKLVNGAWEQGHLFPTLNGPLDRLFSGQRMLPEVHCLMSKNKRYSLTFKTSPVSGEAGEIFQEVMLCLDDAQEKVKKYYLLADRPTGTKLAWLTFVNANLEILEADGTTIAWTSDSSPRQRDKYRTKDGYPASRYEFILQDNGNAVIYIVADRLDSDLYFQKRRREVRDEFLWRRSYNPNDREYQRSVDQMIIDALARFDEDRFPRSIVWALSDEKSFGSLSWPGRSLLPKGQKLLSGQALTHPHASTTLKLQEDGNLVLYGDDGPIWASNTKKKGQYDASVDYLVLQDDGDLVLSSDRECKEVISTPWSSSSRTWTATTVLWRSGTGGQPSSQDKCMKIQPGRMAIYIDSRPIWESDKQNWKPA